MCAWMDEAQQLSDLGILLSSEPWVWILNWVWLDGSGNASVKVPIQWSDQGTYDHSIEF